MAEHAREANKVTLLSTYMKLYTTIFGEKGTAALLLILEGTLVLIFYMHDAVESALLATYTLAMMSTSSDDCK